jgi:hypothetical protein
MSKIKDMMYDIEQMYIEGFNAKSIAVQLSIPYEEVLKVLESWSVADLPQEEMNPYETINS